MKFSALLASICFLSISVMGQVAEGNLLGQWSVDTLVGSRAFNNTYNEVWGLEKDGREYAIIGSTYGTHFIDVTDPSNPIEVTQVPGGAQGPEIIHRDYHDYNGYLYAVADEGFNSTLQIMDLSSLPDSVQIVYDNNLAIRRSHNIFIDSSRARLYSCISAGDTLSFAPMRIFDIADPENPELIGTYFSFDGYGISQVHDIYVEKDTAFLNCGPRGLIIAEFSDPDNPTTFSILEPMDYPDAGYNHSGYRTGDGRFYVMADEDWGFDMKLYNVEDLEDPQLVSLVNAESEFDFSIAHNQLIKDHYLYSSYYYDGLQVFDISDPETPRRVMEYKTTDLAHRRNYEGNWGVYPYLPSGNILLSDMQYGLFVLGPIDDITATDDLISTNKKTIIYPNPARSGEIITIHPDILAIQEGAHLQISNVQGQILFSERLQESSIALPELTPGTYTISINGISSALIVK